MIPTKKSRCPSDLRNSITSREEIRTGDHHATARFIQRTERYLADLVYRVDHTKALSDDDADCLCHKIEEIRDLLDQGEVDAAREQTEALVELEGERLQPKEKPLLRIYLEAVVVGLIAAIFVRGFVAEAYRIPSGSMLPTLYVGDHIFANKLSYEMRFPFTDFSMLRWSTPQRGDVVVFRFPTEGARRFRAQHAGESGCLTTHELESDKTMVKRVIGLPGDRVELKKDQLFLNGEPMKQTFIREGKSGDGLHPINDIIRENLPGGRNYYIQSQGHPKSMDQRFVPEGMLFVLGDNRDNSSDSRCWGWVPIDHVVGKASLIWLSMDEEESTIRWDRMWGLVD